MSINRPGKKTVPGLEGIPEGALVPPFPTSPDGSITAAYADSDHIPRTEKWEPPKYATGGATPEMLEQAKWIGTYLSNQGVNSRGMLRWVLTHVDKDEPLSVLKGIGPERLEILAWLLTLPAGLWQKYTGLPDRLDGEPQIELATTPIERWPVRQMIQEIKTMRKHLPGYVPGEPYVPGSFVPTDEEDD